MADSQADPGRRAFLSRTAGMLGTFLAAALGVTLVGAVVAPATRRETAQWVKLGAVSDFKPGEPRMVTFGANKVDGYLRTTAPRAVWIIRTPADHFTVYNARCTHLGCLVSLRSSSRSFACPCHGGVFAVDDGAVLDGPPPRSLDSLNQRVEDGNLLVQYQDFLVGTPERVPL